MKDFFKLVLLMALWLAAIVAINMPSPPTPECQFLQAKAQSIREAQGATQLPKND
jgi:hypothetical protein